MYEDVRGEMIVQGIAWIACAIEALLLIYCAISYFS